LSRTLLRRPVPYQTPRRRRSSGAARARPLPVLPALDSNSATSGAGCHMGSGDHSTMSPFRLGFIRAGVQNDLSREYGLEITGSPLDAEGPGTHSRLRAKVGDYGDLCAHAKPERATAAVTFNRSRDPVLSSFNILFLLECSLPSRGCAEDCYGLPRS
jgi:hypothetical protein